MAQITALMTTYNCAAYVEETIESILAQTFSDFEFLIIDDGSTDDTCQRIARFSDPRIRFYRHTDNQGVGARLSQALELINTPYVAKVDADDISLPQRFRSQLNYLHGHPELDIVKSYFEYFTEDTEVAKSPRFQQFRVVKELEHNSINTPEQIACELRRWNCVMHTSYFARTATVKLLGYEKIRVGEDYSLFFRAVKAGILIGCVPEVLVKMRLSQTSVTTRPDAAMHFANILCQLKRQEIAHLAALHGQLWLYGTGSLAKSSMHSLMEQGVNCAGFIDRTAGEVELSCGKRFPVLALDQGLPKGVVIAAQPVRSEISQLLQSRGWQEWQDFMVIA